MRKGIGLGLAVAVGIQIASAGVVGAAYHPNGDTTVNVSTGSTPTGTSSTGQTTYQLQEAINQAVTNVTGVSVDHSYIWVDVNGTPVLAVDPPSVMF